MNEIRISHYDDRCDPYPPNNWRPEIIVGNKTFVNFSEFLSGHNGCMPLKKAINKGKALAKALRIKFKVPEVYGYDKDGNKLICGHTTD